MHTPEFSTYYTALCARDHRFDGVFFVGVRSTGIYCRPVCRVRTPLARSCRFFASAAAAEEAGFRPCLKCRPELAPYDVQNNLAHAIWQRIAAGGLNGQNLARFSQQIGLSERQIRRVLTQQFGVSPLELAQTQRLLFAKKLLQETHLPMIEVACAAGFSSVRRFNALFAQRYGLAPSTLRRARPGVMDGLILRLAYRPPYAWDAILHYLKTRAIPGVEAVPDNSSYVRSVRLPGMSGWLRITHLLAQQLQIQLSAECTPQLMAIMARLRNLFDLDANPAIIAAHLCHDGLLAGQLERTPGMRVPGAFDAYELAIRAILGQQISVAGATTIAGRLVRAFGTPVTTPFAEVTHHFPAPDVLAKTDATAIAGLGMPLKRAETVLQMARFVDAGGLDTTGASLDETVTRLREIPGIGMWTAQYIAMRALRYPDAFPAGDLGLQKAAAPDGGRLNEKQLQQRSTEWAPWRAYAALLLWQSLSPIF